MKLTQLFSGEVRSEGRTQMTPAQAESMSRHMRSLVPGQTVSGEIVARNGSEVAIKLSDDMILNARVDRSMNIEVGKNMTFEVKSNGSALTLSPLFTNVSTDTNVLKALNMAGLPVNQASVEMTEQLMAAALPVNKNMLQQIYREIHNFPQGTISDVINLHKLQMPVNEANMNQMASYRNLTHYLTEGMDAIVESLPEVLGAMAEEGDIQGALGLFQKIFMLGQEMQKIPEEPAVGGSLPEAVPEEGVPGNPESAEGLPKGQEGAVPEKNLAQGIKNLLMGTEDLVQGARNTAQGGKEAAVGQENTAQAVKNLLTNGEEILPGEEGDPVQGGAASSRAEGAVQKQVFSDNVLQEPGTGTVQGEISQELRAALSREILDLLGKSNLPPREEGALRAQVAQFVQGQGGPQQLFSALALMAEGAQLSARTSHAWGKLLSGKAFQELLTGALKDKWTIRPEELSSPGKVEDLYRHLDRQLRALAGALEEAGQSSSAAFRATTSLSQNVDFLQQVNQMYAYVQLPLKLQNREAHGELYVYANRKRLASREGSTSALLHLDMENLGPVDVYVTMQSSRVSTKFYLRDEEMIDFIGAHMDLLTSRLSKRGYECSCSMSVRESGTGEEEKSGLAPVLNQEKGILLSQYAFDVRT